MSVQGPLNGRYTIRQLIGKGSFGDVFLAFDQLTHKRVAVKQLKQSRAQLQRRNSNFQRQIQLMTALKHPNIVCMVEQFQFRGNVFIVTEYCSNGDLSKLIKDQNLTNQQIIKIFRQIIQGLVYIHKQGYIHRDLKPDNILIDENFVAKVADFGLSKKFQEGIRNTQMYGTPMYAPPSFLQGEEHYTQKCDVYSLGLTIATVLKGNHIFDGAKNLVQLQKMQRELTPESLREKLMGVDEKFIKLLESCLTVNENQRKTIFQLQKLFGQLFPEQVILELPRDNVQKILKKIQNLKSSLGKSIKFLQIHGLLTKQPLEPIQLDKYAYASILTYMKQVKKVNLQIAQTKSVLDSANDVLKQLSLGLEQQFNKCSKTLTQLKNKIGFEPFLHDPQNVLKTLLMNKPNEQKYLSMIGTQ